MLTDLFEMDGWDTYYMSASMPAESIVAAINERSAGIVAISVTMPFRLEKLQA